ncbi:MAG TPA: right-handed parallel beta-helix repeat-containing protein [Thermoanaerobaculia bacterium]|nr:right-handed parallel beta-helix repeat-containing protein [Thermoanaerobaculia bacterium]
MKLRIPVLLLLVAILAFGAFSAHAQATRTWVSGVGDDVNPCSRTAPCKTFAGAISKTAAGGEISVLDPGGYGAVTITKSITINGRAQISSILSSGTSGVIVNAGANDVVTLKDLDINGGSNTLSIAGVRYLAGKQLNVENCRIWAVDGSPGRGIHVAGSGAVTMNLYVSNTTISDNAGSGIVILPTSGTPTVHAYVTDSIIKHNDGATTSGIFAGEGARVTVKNTLIAGHTAAGIDAGGTTVPSIVTVDNSHIVNNATGLLASGGTLRILRSVVANNATRGFNIAAGSIASSGDNRFINNGANVGVLGSVPAQ